MMIPSYRQIRVSRAILVDEWEEFNWSLVDKSEIQFSLKAIQVDLSSVGLHSACLDTQAWVSMCLQKGD